MDTGKEDPIRKLNEELENNQSKIKSFIKYSFLSHNRVMTVVCLIAFFISFISYSPQEIPNYLNNLFILILAFLGVIFFYFRNEFDELNEKLDKVKK